MKQIWGSEDMQIWGLHWEKENLRSFILHYLQQNVMPIFHELKKTLFSALYPFKGEQGQIIFLENQLSLLFSVSRFLSLCKISKKPNINRFEEKLLSDVSTSTNL